MKDERRNFDKEAAHWDANPSRVKLATDVANAIIRETSPSTGMDVLDFGCGTGLVTLRLQPLVRNILGVDGSQGMLAVLENKIKSLGISNVRTRFVDLEKGGRVEGAFDLIVSSMVLHHVPDTAALFQEWLHLLKPDGMLCFADLDTEDGSFHGDNTGVFHRGFDRAHLMQLLAQTGFNEIRDTTAATVTRDAEVNRKRTFPVFLIIARK